MSDIKVTPIGDPKGTDLTVVNAARVSFGKRSQWEYDERLRKEVISERDAKLIRYLARHKHLSPFGHCFASFHIKVPIVVARQLVKHEYLRWSEISRRYVDDPPEFYRPELRLKAENVKQGSSDEVLEDDPYLLDALEIHAKNALILYDAMVNDSEVAPEVARFYLPQGTMTEAYWSGSLDAFAKMCKLRCAPDTQKETRIAADAISNHMGRWFPVSWKELMDAD
jgi:thymidylate synthase (FAD)